jgi:pyridoxine kinase
MARILAISSQVVFGPVGNTAAVPPMLAMGHEVLQVPTVLLSNHPGHGPPKGQAIDPQLLAGLISRALELTAVDAVLTGYFANAEQVNIVSTLMKQIDPEHILVDPVIGDHGRLYVADTTATAIRDHLLPLATITTPNAFELSWLTGLIVDGAPSAERAAHLLGVPETIATSVAAAPGRLATLLVSDAETQAHVTEQRTNVPHGTGDFLSGCYLAHRLRHDPAAAFTNAMQELEHAIANSNGSVLTVS